MINILFQKKITWKYRKCHPMKNWNPWLLSTRQKLFQNTIWCMKPLISQKTVSRDNAQNILKYRWIKASIFYMRIINNAFIKFISACFFIFYTNVTLYKSSHSDRTIWWRFPCLKYFLFYLFVYDFSNFGQLCI